MVRRIEEDRPLVLKRIAEYSDAQRKLAIKTFEDSLRSAKQKVDLLLAERERH
jgi:hypothetical protein